jgi:alpha-ketoglutarate-dependent taurine dioxygenase
MISLTSKPRYSNSERSQPKKAILRALRQRLDERGIVLARTEPGDTTGRTMRQIVAALGRADVHDAGGRQVWDIRYKPEAVDGTRSLTLKAFPYHTDGSFEDPSPTAIALYVVREDRFGGGDTLLIEAAQALRQLSDEALDVLRTTRFRFQIPAEFAKDVPYRDLPILLGPDRLRYRREILDETRCAPMQVAALDALDAALAAVEPIRMTLRSGTILLLDNARFLHARTELRDPERHLLRMRFSARNAQKIMQEM